MATKKKVARKKAPKEGITALQRALSEKDKARAEFGAKDKVLVTYQSKWYDIVDVPAVILRANRTGGWPFHIRLEDAEGKVINMGHDDDGGEPGTGPFMYLDAENLRMVEKYTPKRLEGSIKTTWKVGDKFIPKNGFCMDQEADDDITGVSDVMLEKCINVELTVIAILPRLGVDWLLDGTENYMWKPEWVDPVE